MHARQVGAHTVAEQRLAGGQRQRPVRATVKPADERHDVGPAGGPPCELDGALDSLGAAVAEEHLVEPRRRNTEHRRSRIDHRLIEGGDRCVPHPIDLLVHRPGDRGVAMPEVGHGDAAAEVEDVSPVGRVQMGTLGGVDDQIRVAAVSAGDQLRIPLAPGRHVRGRGRRHGRAPCEAASAALAGTFGATDWPTLPRLRKPANIRAMPTAS